MSEEQLFTLSQAQLELAKSTYNGIWDLLSKTERTPEEDREMLLAAYTSLFHWKKVGTAVNYQRGCWMISRVHQTLGDVENALEWAHLCQKITAEHPGEMMDFDLAFAQESLARANALAGNLEQARIHWDQAAALGERIGDPEDRKIFLNDFQGGDWYQLADG